MPDTRGPGAAKTDTRGHRSLDVFDFGVLLQALAQSQKVGTLRMVAGSREKYVHLERGRIMAIVTPKSRFRIGRILYDMHALEMDDLRTALEDVKSGRAEGQLGEVLESRGLVTADQLTDALRTQMVEEILEVFYWKEVSYEFFADSPEHALGSRIAGYTQVGGPVDADWLLLQVTKTIDDIEKFNSVTPSLRDVYELVRNPEEYLAQKDTPPTMRSLVELIDSRRDMGEVLQAMRMNRFDVMDLFCKLRTNGHIKPKNAYELLTLAENQRNVFPASKLARLYERVSELGLDGFDVLMRTGEVYEKLGKYEKAAAKYVEHARKMEREADLDAAEEATARAANAQPDSTEVRTYRAHILRELGRESEFTTELLEVARLQQERGQNEEADATLVSALETRPKDEQVIRARIEVLRRVARLRLAARTCLRLSAVREEKQNLTGAEEALRLAVEIAPRMFRPYASLAAFLIRAGKQDRAAAVLADLVPVIIERASNHFRRATKMLDRIVAQLREMREQGSRAMFVVAGAYLELGMRDRGLELLVENGEARIASSSWNDAVETYTRAVEAAPQDLDLAETLALVGAKVGDRDQALARLRRIAVLYQKKGQAERSEGAYREMLRLNPFSPDALLGIARLKADRGEKREAAALLHQLGHLYRTSGALEDATEYFDEACRLDPSNPDYVRVLGDCLEKVLKMKQCLDSYDALLAMLRARSDHTGALDIAFRILEIDPDHEMANQALVESYRALGRKVRSSARSFAEQGEAV